MLDQMSVIKFLLAKKYKPCEIYRRMYDVYWEACFNPKKCLSGLNMGLPLQAWMEKTVHEVETHWRHGIDFLEKVEV